MQVTCPQCKSSIRNVETAEGEILCPVCGSSFRLKQATTKTWKAQPEQRTLGRFELIETAGTGGFGTVYRARDPELDRTVAIKVPRSGSLASKGDLERFVREARSVAKLRHPSIVSVYEVGKAEGVPFLVSDFVEGVTLADWLSSHRPGPRKAARLIAAVADAIHYAHEHGVIHRDLKPSNIMLGADERPVVMDFGLARREAGDPTMTREGDVLGTPAYMSPEQARGQSHRVDGRSDVYSIGAIFYQLLTGKLPFRGNARMILHQLLHDEPRPPRSLNKKIPRDLETICQKAMAATPAERYETARELADDLRRFLKGEAILARPPSVWERARRWAKRRRTLVAAAAVGLLALAGLAGFMIWHVASVRETVAVGELQRKAVEQKREIETQKREFAEELTKKTDEVARRNAYASRAALIQVAWREGKVRRVQEILEQQLPEPGQPDLRGFEWHYFNRLVQESQLALAGHKDKVTAVAFRPDHRLASASLDRTVKIWELATGVELRTLSGASAGLLGVAFSQDRVAAVGQDGAVALWDAATGKMLCTVKGQENAPASFALSADGKRLVVARGNEVRICDATSGQDGPSFAGHQDKVTAVAFSADGDKVAAASEGGAVKIWETAGGKELKSVAMSSVAIARLAFMPNGKLRMIFRNGSIGHWNWQTDESGPQPSDADAGSPVTALSHDGKRFASLAPSISVRISDSAGGGELFALRGHTAPITSIVFNMDDRLVATASEDHTVRVWNLQFGWSALKLRDHHAGVNAVQFSPDGRLLASAGGDGTVRVREPTTGQETLVVHAHSPTKEIAASSPDRAAHHLKGATCVVFDPDGKRLASAGADGIIRVWDATSGRQLVEWTAHARGVAGLAFHPGGRRLASASWDKTVRVWDAETGKQVCACQGHQREVVGVAFSHDGKLLATGSWDYSVKLWDPETGREVRSCLGHVRIVESVAFSPDGRYVAGASNGFDLPGETKIWETATGKEVHTLKGHVYGIYHVAFSKDGSRLASVACEGAAKLYDTKTGQELFTFHLGLDTAHAYYSVAFSPDGRRLAIGSRDHFLYVLDSIPLSAEARVELASYNAVANQFNRLVVKSDVLKTIQADPWISEPLRRESLARAERYLQDPIWLNAVSWEAIKKPNGDPAKYRKALLQAQEAVRLRPDDGDVLNTLGVAQYRVGDHQAAIDTLTRSDQLNAPRFKGSIPSDLAFMALASHSLGKRQDAQKYRERLREAMKSPVWSRQSEAQNFAREVEAKLSK
jgi:WD40 repeat protein